MKSSKESSGTSYHGVNICETYNELVAILGTPQYECNDGSDKCNFDWTCELPDGRVFTIYDWKEYRRIRPDEVIEWHIGGFDFETTDDAADYLRNLLMSEDTINETN